MKVNGSIFGAAAFLIVALAALLLGRSSNAAEINVVSRPFEARPSTFGDSSDLELSADGKWAVYSSNGTGITTNQAAEFTLNVFLKNLESGETTLVSRAGNSGGNAHSYGARISADGSVLVFETDADDLVEDDANEATDVMLYDRVAGTLTVLSGTTNGVAEGSSGAVSITPNGRFILFESDATDFSSLDTNDSADLYLFERETATTQLVTVNSNGTAAAASAFPVSSIGTFEGSVSGDGRYVAFVSGPANYVVGLPTTAGPQVFLRDMTTGTNFWLSRGADGTPGLSVSSPAISSNGQYVAFIAGRLDGTSSTSIDGFLYLYETRTGSRKAIVAPTGIRIPVNEFSFSGNSEFLAFTSSNQVYLHEIAAASTRLISATGGGAPAAGISTSPQLSDDGRSVVFISTAADLPGGNSDELYQMYRADTQTGEIVLLSRNADSSGGANADTVFPVVSGNGAVAGFMSYASNLVTNDNVLLNDVFAVSTSGTNAVILVSTPHPAAFSATAGGDSSIQGPGLSADGSRLIFTSIAPDLVPNDTNGARDIFLHDLQTGATRLVSVGTNGTALAGASSLAGLSQDARVIAFVSGNVVNGTNVNSIFVGDVLAGSIKVGNVLPDREISATIGDAALSADGRYLAFRTNTQGTIYVRDLHTETTVALTTPTSATQILGFSPGGKYLVVRGFGASYSLVDWRSNLVTLNLPPLSLGYLTNAFSANDAIFIAPVRINLLNVLQLFMLDTGTNATVVASNVWTAGVSADGSTIAYLASSSNLTADYSLYLHDVKSGTSSPVQIGGTNAVFRTRGQLALSADGRFIAFAVTNALIGLPGEGDFADIYIYDRVLKMIRLATQRLPGAEEFGGAVTPLLSADKRVLAFDSAAADLVANDRNLSGDVFIRRFTAVDVDADGMEDGWELLQFGGLAAAPGSDADNDGVSNRNEFHAGSDPNNAGSRFEVASAAETQTGRLLIASPASAGRKYQLQHRASLSAGDWEDVGSVVVAYSDEVIFETSLSAQGSGFFRVEALE